MKKPDYQLMFIVGVFLSLFGLLYLEDVRQKQLIYDQYEQHD